MSIFGGPQRCISCIKLRKDKKLLITDLNKANDQIGGLEDVIFELDKRLEQAKLKLEGQTSEPDQSGAEEIHSSSSRFTNASGRLGLITDSEPFAQRLSRERSSRKLPVEDENEGDGSAEQAGETVSGGNLYLARDNLLLQSNISDMQKLLTTKESQLTDTTNKLQSAQEQLAQLQSRSNGEIRRSSAMSQRSRSGSTHSYSDPRNMNIKIGLVKQKLCQERQKSAHDQLVLAHALEAVVVENRKIQEALAEVRSDKDHIEELFFEAVARQQEAHKKERQLSDELGRVRSHVGGPTLPPKVSSAHAARSFFVSSTAHQQHGSRTSVHNGHKASTHTISADLLASPVYSKIEEHATDFQPSSKGELGLPSEKNQAALSPPAGTPKTRKKKSRFWRRQSEPV